MRAATRRAQPLRGQRLVVLTVGPLYVVHVKQAFCLFAAFALSGMISPAAAQISQAPVILAVNDARAGQLRYLGHLLDHDVVLSHRPSSARCLGSGIREAEACVRTRDYVDAPLVLILTDVKTADEESPGLARLVCIGSGEAPHDQDAQSITLWPRAYGLRSVTDFARDRDRLRGCIDAASAEARK